MCKCNAAAIMSCVCLPSTPDPRTVIDWTKPLQLVQGARIRSVRLVCSDRKHPVCTHLLLVSDDNFKGEEFPAHCDVHGYASGIGYVENVPPPKKRVKVVVYQWTGLSSGPTICTTRFFSDAQGNISGFDEMGKTPLHYDTGDRKILSDVIVEYDA